MNGFLSFSIRIKEMDIKPYNLILVNETDGRMAKFLVKKNKTKNLWVLQFNYQSNYLIFHLDTFLNY